METKQKVSLYLREVGVRLRSFREMLSIYNSPQKKRLTRAEFAKIVGVNAHNINDYERGASDMPCLVMSRLFDIGCNLNWLVTGMGQPFFQPQEPAIGEPIGGEVSPAEVSLSMVKRVAEISDNNDLSLEVLSERITHLEELIETLLQREKFHRPLTASQESRGKDG